MYERKIPLILFANKSLYVNKSTLPSQILSASFFIAGTVGRSGDHRHSGIDCPAEPDAIDLSGEGN